MKSKILIFSATYNESKNITLLLNYIEELNLDLDILIVDDNSPDRTWEIVKNYSKSKKNIHLIVREKKSGLDTAHKLAYEYSLNNNYDYLITIDADLTHDPKKIPEFIKELKNHPFVLGSRFVEGGSLDTTGWRRALSIFGNKFIKIIFGIKSNEFTTAFRGYDLKKLENFDLRDVKSKGYSFFMETIYLLNKKNILIKEIPFHAKLRHKGDSKIERVEIFRTLINVLRLKFFNN